MKVPRAQQAIVEERKITLYLLNEASRDGAPKAAFFKRFGFHHDAPGILARALRNHVADNEAASAEETPFGTRFVVEGPLPTPDGRAPLVRTIWMAHEDDAPPRLVTAYPLRRRDVRM